MYRVKIKNINVEKEFAYKDFETETLATEYVEEVTASEHWGKREKTEMLVHKEVPAVIKGETLVTAAIPSWSEEITVPAEVVFEIVDITADLQKAQIKKEIALLEAQITSRRIREALLTGNKSFIEEIENQINELRSQL